MKPYTIILWGASYDYDKYFHYLELEKNKGNIQIEGMILNEENFAKSIDHIPILSPQEILEHDFDYLVVLTKNTWDMVLQIGKLWKIPREKILQAELFTLPRFDFERWVRVRREKVSIVSNQCWGGMTYETLQMPFYSPLVGMYESDEDYLKLVGDLEHYLSCKLECVEWVNYQGKEYPIVACDDIKIIMNHHFGNFEDTVKKWNRRMERFQYDNVCVQMFVNDERLLDKFLKLPYQKKIAFTMIPYEHHQVIWMEEGYLRKKYGDQIFNAPLQQAVLGRNEFVRYDVLSLLLGEEKYKRYENEKVKNADYNREAWKNKE